MYLLPDTFILLSQSHAAPLVKDRTLDFLSTGYAAELSINRAKSRNPAPSRL